MEKFKKRELKQESFLSNDDGIEINKLLSLVNNHEYYSDILSYFNVDQDSQEKINIRGAKSLYTILKSIDKNYKKIDLKSNLQDIYFDYTKGFSIRFSNLSSNNYFNEIVRGEIIATPIHSAERDFFSNLYEIDKYASKLIASKYNDILDKNLELLKSKNKHVRKYRLLHDSKEDKFYLRAIISEDRYFDYNNSIAFVVALLKLHFEAATQSNINYELYLCEYNESFIRMYFRTSETKELKGVGFLENILQISNDEIKREALRFSSICSIWFTNSLKESKNLFIKPRDVKSRVLSITHGTGPKKAFQNLEDFVKSKNIFEKLSKEIEGITKIKSHNQIVHLVKSKIEKSNTEEIKRYKDELIKLLYKDIKTTTQLLETFNKLMFLEGLEIDAKEYLRYLIYEALIERK